MGRVGRIRRGGRRRTQQGDLGPGILQLGVQVLNLRLVEAAAAGQLEDGLVFLAE